MEFLPEEKGYDYEFDKKYSQKQMDDALLHAYENGVYDGQYCCDENIKKAVKKQAKDIHDELDNLNGEQGNLCLYCGAQNYNGKVGIIHNKSCIILKLRKLF